MSEAGLLLVDSFDARQDSLGATGTLAPLTQPIRRVGAGLTTNQLHEMFRREDSLRWVALTDGPQPTLIQRSSFESPVTGAFARLLGRPAGDLLSMSLAQFLHPDDGGDDVHTYQALLLAPSSSRTSSPADGQSKSEHAQILTSSRKCTRLASMRAADYEDLLRSAQLRVTRPRLGVLAAVHDLAHADTDAIIDAARASLGDVSHQAVYDVLRALTQAGLVRRIQPPGSVARYESRVADNHHHAVCRSCGAIADVDCAVGHAPCLSASDEHDFLIDEAEVTYWGICPACRSAAEHHHTIS